MLRPQRYAAARIKPATYIDTSHLHEVAFAAGASDVPMHTAPAMGWPDSTCTAVIAAVERRQPGTANVPMYPFFVGDAACRRIRDYKSLRAVANACAKWNTFIDECIAAHIESGPVPPFLTRLAHDLEEAWQLIDPTTAAATATALGALCSSAPARAAAVAAWRGAAAYLTEGTDAHLHVAMTNGMLVDKPALVAHAAAAEMSKCLGLAEAAVRVRAPGSMATYTANVHAAIAWSKSAGATTNPRFNFHLETLRRSKTDTVPVETMAAVARTIAGWSSKRSI